MKQTQTFENLKIFLDHHLNQSTNDRVAVFPIRCGIGKSKYVNYLISDYIRNRISDTIHNNSDGLIIVTDSIDRMKDYC